MIQQASKYVCLSLWPCLTFRGEITYILKLVYLNGNNAAEGENNNKGAFVWDQSGIGIIGIMQVSVCLGAILIPEYLDSILAILLPGAE